MNLGFMDPGLRKARFFLHIRSRLEPDIRCFYFSRRRAVRSWIKSAGCTAYPRSAAPRSPLRRYTDEELLRAIGPKEAALRRTKSLRLARELLTQLSHFLDTCEIDSLLVWNGSNLQLSLAIFLARQRGISIIFAEHGYLPDTMQLDLKGVNHASSLTDEVVKGRAKLQSDPKIDAQLDKVLSCFKSGHPPRVIVTTPPECYRTDAVSRVQHYINARFKDWYRARLWREGHAMGLDAKALPERFVLVPLQVQKDSQLILHSPLIGNDLRRLLALVERAAGMVDATLRVVVKLHPQEQPHVQKRHLRLLSEFPRITFVSKPPMRDLLPHASAIVTVNSTVGFEAFLYDKPVVTLGRNFYTSPHLVEPVTSEQHLPAALTRALSEPVDIEQRRAFLRFVHSRFLVSGTYRDYSEESQLAVAHRVRELLAKAAESRDSRPMCGLG